MLEIIIIIGSFILIAVVCYFAIGRLFDVIDPNPANARKYRVAADDVVFLHQARKYFDPKRCVLYTGQGSEILSEMKQTKVDFAVLEGNEENPESAVRIDYDVPEPFESKIVKSIVFRDVYKTVKIKFTQDAGTENEISRELTVPANSDIMPYTINSDGNLYSDPECTKLMEGNWDYNSDLTAYLKSVEAQPAE